MTRRDCPECGNSALLTAFGAKRVYQGTKSWKEMRDSVERLENNPHADRVCMDCEAVV